MEATSTTDLVTLVNEQGKPVGQLDKIVAHQGEGVLHLACSVFLFRKNSKTGSIELLIQQRSPLKIVGQWQWANTACGNVRPSESPKECVLRRLREELHLTRQQPQEIATLLYSTKCNEEFSEREFDHIFAGWFVEDDLLPNPAEAVAIEWASWGELCGNALISNAISMVNKEDIGPMGGWRDFAPWFRLMVVDRKVQRALAQFIE